MTKKEFQELKEEFAAVTCKFEQFNKKINEIRAKYNKYFFDQIQTSKHIMAETVLLTNLVSLKAKGESDDTIEKTKNDFVNKVLSEEKEDILNHTKLTRIADNFENTSKEDNEKFEFLVENFILDYHPYVNINMNPNVQNVFKLLMKFYYENNIGGFEEVFEMNKQALSHPELAEEDYNRAQTLYNQFKMFYQKNYNDNKNKFPLNKQIVFLNDVALDSERDELEIAIKKELKMNEAIHKDYVATFGSDYKIPFVNR